MHRPQMGRLQKETDQTGVKLESPDSDDRSLGPRGHDIIRREDRNPLPETAKPLMSETCKSSSSTWLLKRVLRVSMTRPLRMGAARFSITPPTTSNTMRETSTIQRNKRQPLALFRAFRGVVVQHVVSYRTQKRIPLGRCHSLCLVSVTGAKSVRFCGEGDVFGLGRPRPAFKSLNLRGQPGVEQGL